MEEDNRVESLKSRRKYKVNFKGVTGEKLSSWKIKNCLPKASG